jgi:hypothetical protein
MTWPVWCPNSAIAAALAGAAEAPDAPMSPNPAATRIARRICRILISCLMIIKLVPQSFLAEASNYSLADSTRTPNYPELKK